MYGGMIMYNNSQTSLVSNELFSFNVKKLAVSKLPLPPDSPKPKSRVGHAAAVV